MCVFLFLVTFYERARVAGDGAAVARTRQKGLRARATTTTVDVRGQVVVWEMSVSASCFYGGACG